MTTEQRQLGFGFVRETDLRVFVAEAYRQVTRRESLPEIEAVYYPFVGLHHTIRVREQRMLVRISDHLREAPETVHRAIAYILVARLFRKRVGVEPLERYRSYIYRSEVQARVEAARRLRGRKRETGAAGRVYQLDLLFDQLNDRFFAGSLPKPRLGWSPRPTRRIFGHYDEVLDTIVISRSLDHPAVPQYVVEFVLYHEMLHLKYPVQIVQGRRRHHTPHFREEERRFPEYESAHEILNAVAEAKNLEHLAGSWRVRNASKGRTKPAANR